MLKVLLILLVSFLMCSCVQTSNPLNVYQNITSELKAKGVEENVVNANLQEISDSIVAILHENYSMDDTFVISDDTSKGLYIVLIPTMKQSGFKVLVKSETDSEDYLPLTYTFTVTNNKLIETADVALLRLWVGDTFQLSKAFTQSIDGLQAKTGFCVMGGTYNE